MFRGRGGKEDRPLGLSLGQKLDLLAEWQSIVSSVWWFSRSGFLPSLFVKEVSARWFCYLNTFQS